jgi:hypothetical protein
MGWLLELLVEIVGGTVADEAARRIPAWGCALIIGVIAVAVLLLVWLT